MLTMINKRKACFDSMIQDAREVCPYAHKTKRANSIPNQKNQNKIKKLHEAILSQSGSDSKCNKNPIPVGIAHVGETISLRLS